MRWATEDLHRYLRRHVRVTRHTVSVTAYARVHLGAIDLAGARPLGGGFGFGVPELPFTVHTHPRGADGPPAAGTVDRYVDPDVLSSVIARMGLDARRVNWTVTGKALQHKGYGSGTQVLVAALQGLRISTGLPPASVKELAEAGIGAQSSIGVRLALDPSPVLDLGRDRDVDDDGSSSYARRVPLAGALRVRFPPKWAGLVLWPVRLQGLDDAADADFWSRILPIPEAQTNAMSRALLLDILAGIAAESFPVFEDGVRRINTAGAKTWEWAAQPEPVRTLAAALRGSGFEPLLSSVGPGMVVLAATTDEVMRAQAVVDLHGGGAWEAQPTHLAWNGG